MRKFLAKSADALATLLDRTQSRAVRATVLASALMICFGIFWALKPEAIHGWDRTTWGMTVTDVAALYPNATIVDHQHATRSMCDDGEHVGIYIPTATEPTGLTVEASLCFDSSGHLTSVHMHGNGPYDYGRIESEYYRKFGSAVEHTIALNFRYYRFLAGQNTSIRTLFSGQQISVIYSKLPGDWAPGQVPQMIAD